MPRTFTIGGAPAAEPEPEPSGVPWGLLSTLGGAAALAAALRHPALSQRARRLWMTPGMPVAGALPAELPLIHARPRPPLSIISEHERIGTSIGEQLGKPKSLLERLGVTRPQPPTGLLRQPWVEEYLKAKAPVFEDVEHRADQIWQALGGTAAARNVAVFATYPNFLRAADAWRQSRLPVEQWAKSVLGLADIPEWPGPYIPRRVSEAARQAERVRDPMGGLFGELRTSLGGFQKTRTFGTMREGVAKGLTYEDPRVSFLLREVNGMRLVETAKFIEKLRGRVLFESEAAARAAFPGGTPTMLEGVPGATKWWAPTKEEARFLKDNLTDPRRGRLAFLTGFGNSLFRNPNLINPAPHFIKNMLYKYGLSGGGPRVFADMVEFWQGRTPLVQRFMQSMPFDLTGMTARESLERTLSGIRRESNVLAPFEVAVRALGGANRFSAQLIFGKLDPALRYARWKQYVARGMPEAEAANHTWVDLIRYGTRSEGVDFWKSIPLNFFVPWRLGTVTSVLKQLESHPFRAALFIGAVDYLREVRYRQTGRWTHLPIDYLEGPIAQLLMARDPNEVGKALVGATLGTFFLGPGGGFAGAQIADAIKFSAGREIEWARLKNMFWGLSQLFNLPHEGAKVMAAFQSGDPSRAASAVADLLGTLALAEHSALNYRPRRLLGALPEALPGMTRSEDVRRAEAMQEARERAATRGRERRLRKREFSIEKRIELMHEGGR